MLRKKDYVEKGCSLKTTQLVDSSFCKVTPSFGGLLNLVFYVLCLPQPVFSSCGMRMN
eukprot:m.45720 g.45720  ORF g.45720 m.45720 type:complete len:58 (-) comp8673_c0_seq1:1132-1305(-)